MRSITLPRAVSITIGTRLRSRIFRHTAKPSIPGSITSSTTMSGGSASRARSPSSGRAAGCTLKPNWPRYSPSSAPSASSSSISSTRVRGAIAAYDPSGRAAQRVDRRQARRLAGRQRAEAEADR